MCLSYYSWNSGWKFFAGRLSFSCPGLNQPQWGSCTDLPWPPPTSVNGDTDNPFNSFSKCMSDVCEVSIVPLSTVKYQNIVLIVHIVNNKNNILQTVLWTLCYISLDNFQNSSGIVIFFPSEDFTLPFFSFKNNRSGHIYCCSLQPASNLFLPQPEVLQVPNFFHGLPQTPARTMVKLTLKGKQEINHDSREYPSCHRRLTSE